MPKCKNDPKTSYTGKEPSPKGLGYCSKKERIGTKKRGKDKKMWIVKKRADGVKLWTRFSNKNKITKKRKYMMKGGVISNKDVVDFYKKAFIKIMIESLESVNNNDPFYINDHWKRFDSNVQNIIKKITEELDLTSEHVNEEDWPTKVLQILEVVGIDILRYILYYPRVIEILGGNTVRRSIRAFVKKHSGYNTLGINPYRTIDLPYFNIGQKVKYLTSSNKMNGEIISIEGEIITVDLDEGDSQIQINSSNPEQMSLLSFY